MKAKGIAVFGLCLFVCAVMLAPLGGCASEKKAKQAEAAAAQAQVDVNNAAKYAKETAEKADLAIAAGAPNAPDLVKQVQDALKAVNELQAKAASLASAAVEERDKYNAAKAAENSRWDSIFGTVEGLATLVGGGGLLGVLTLILGKRAGQVQGQAQGTINGLLEGARQVKRAVDSATALYDTIISKGGSVAEANAAYDKQLEEEIKHAHPKVWDAMNPGVLNAA